MKPTELRIGNYLEFEGTVFVVTEIDHQGVAVKNDFEDTWIDLFQMNPIPLTEKWFDKTKDDWTLDEASDEHYEFNVDGVQWCQILKKELQFVHQLQNLYFALTGEELTITK